MKKTALDLHIHSCLSPCASEDMTPNNIVNMAKLKGLDIISICDHNHTGNLSSILKVAEEKGLALLPGLELETSEETHLLCYFPDIHQAEQMQQILNRHYRDIKIREDIFGTQWIRNENDKPVKKIDHLLSTATTLDLYQAVSIVRELGGMIVPAHIDRASYSLLSNLGTIPPDLELNTLELSRNTTRIEFLSKYPEYKERFFIFSSDAHDLSMIFERQFFMELEEISVPCLFNKLKNRYN